MKSLLRPYLQLLLLSGLLLVSRAAPAQAPGTGGPTPDPDDPTAVPLDGGASVLLAGGLAYGLRRLRLTAKSLAQQPGNS